MRIVIIILLFFTFSCFGQDKIFLKNGKTLNGIVVSVSSEIVYFKLTDTSATQKLKKTDILLIVAARGTRYIFGEDSSPKLRNASEPTGFKRNSVGMQPFGIFSGRITFIYERLNKTGTIGVAIPLILTFDPTGSVLKLDSARTTERIPGMKLITGLDVNFYVVKKQYSQLFVGPRIRYGTDMLLGNIEGYSIQTQIGYRFGKPEKLFSQHLSVGFGVAGILTPPAGAVVPAGQFYSWFSLNYRLAFNW